VTPAQLAVERDALLQGGRTLEEVEAMQGRLREVWVVQHHYDYEGEELVAVCLTREGALCAARVRAAELDYVPQEFERGSGVRLELSTSAQIWVDRVRLSPPETRTGASAPRPSGETHVTEWGLYMLATSPSTRVVDGLSDALITEMEAAGFNAACAACTSEALAVALAVGDGPDIGYHDIHTTVPTCPRCAVLRDEALDGRLPKREAKT